MWKKIIAPTALVSALWIAVSGTTTLYLKHLDNSQTEELDAHRNTIQSAGKMQEVLWRLQTAVMETAHHKRFLTQGNVNNWERLFEQALIEAKRTGSTPGELRLIANIESQFSTYKSEIHLLERQGPEAFGKSTAVEQMMSLARSTARSCEDLLEMSQGLDEESFRRRDRLRRKVTWIRMGFLIAGPAIGILSGFFVASGLHRSISEISVTLKDASGDLVQEVGCVELRNRRFW